MSADSLENDFLVENVLLSDAEVEQEDEAQVEKVSKSSKKRNSALTFEDLGIDATESTQNSLIPLLDELYNDKPKPLVVKSHTKVKVLIVCSAALRCLELIKELKSVPNLKVAKLFAKHMKIQDQIRALKKSPFLLAVGTPARILKILEQDEDAIPLKKLEYLIIDGSFKNKKEMTIYDLLDTQMDLKKLTEFLKDHVESIISF